MTVMFLLLLGLFLTFAAFAIDLGNYYLWQLRIDKAARSGVLAGLGARGLKGWRNTDSNSSILATATQQAVAENLGVYGLTTGTSGTPQNYSVVHSWNRDSDQLTVTVRYDMPTIFVGRIGKILGYGFNTISSDPSVGQQQSGTNSISLATSQTAQLSRANVVLILDVSGSMLCPITDPATFAGQPPCACRRSTDPNACGGAATKLSAMAQGVVNFVSQFNPGRDRITVIPFNLAARKLFSFVEYNTINGAGSSRTATMQNLTLRNPITNSSGAVVVEAGTSAWNMLTNLSTVTAGLTAIAGSNTNHCDALAESIRELETLSTDILGIGIAEADRRKLQPFVVFFTDGAPNAMRGIFPDTSSNSGGDFYHYALEWIVANPIPNSTPYTYRGPGPFVLRTNDSTNPSLVQPLFKFAISANNVAPFGSTTCGTEQSNFYDFEKTITRSTSGGVRGDAVRGCLTTSSFRFSIPYTNFDATGSQIPTYQAQVENVPISTATTTWRDPNWPIVANPPAYGLQKYDELPYYCAVEAADYLRLHFGATIYAIGLGPTTAYNSAFSNPATDTSCNDPLMDADDHSGRKDFFLSRLAFSRQMFANQVLPTAIGSPYQINVSQSARTVSNCSRHRYKTPFGAPGLAIGYTSPTILDSLPSLTKSDDRADAFKALRPFKPSMMDYNNSGATQYRRIETVGEYFPTNDATEVPSIFSNIAKTILLRSTS